MEDVSDAEINSTEITVISHFCEEVDIEKIIKKIIAELKSDAIFTQSILILSDSLHQMKLFMDVIEEDDSIIGDAMIFRLGFSQRTSNKGEAIITGMSFYEAQKIYFEE